MTISFCLLVIIAAACRPQPAHDVTANRFGHANLVYMGREQQVQVYDVAQPGNLELIATWDTPGPVRRIVTNGDKLLVVYEPSHNSGSSEPETLDGGVQLVDVSRPRQPDIQATLHTPNWTEDLLLHGDVVYLADWEGLSVVEWARPTRPREVARLPMEMGRLAIDGDLLLGVWGGCSFRSGACQGGLWLADISQPQQPHFLADLASEQRPGYDVALLHTAVHRYALVAGLGLWVVDITDPASPQGVAQQELTDGFYHSRIVVKENHAILATDAHIRVYDMSQPDNPRLVGQMNWNSPPLDMMLAHHGDHVYLVSWDGLSIIDVRDPTRPFLVATTHDALVPNPIPTATP